jgi:Mg-chelatase subunit ChlD
MPLGALTFLTPEAGLIALAAVLPVAALLLADRRLEAARRVLRLPPPGAAGRAGTIAALVAVPLLLGLAAAQPVVRRDQGQRVRTDAEAMYVVDISRSMAAAGRPGGENRLARARAAAITLRSELHEVPSGLATLTDRALPSLFPVADQATFDSAARGLLLEQPPPQGSSSTATTFAPLAEVARKNYFAPDAKKRVVVLVTDGESVPFDANEVADALHDASLVVLRVGSAGERVYRPDGLPEAYRPAPTTALDSLASATGSRVLTSTGAAAAAARAALGDGPTAVQGRARSSTPLAPWIALVAALVLLYILRRRNFTNASIALPARGT